MGFPQVTRKRSFTIRPSAQITTSYGFPSRWGVGQGSRLVRTVCEQKIKMRLSSTAKKRTAGDLPTISQSPPFETEAIPGWGFDSSYSFYQLHSRLGRLTFQIVKHIGKQASSHSKTTNNQEKPWNQPWNKP